MLRSCKTFIFDADGTLWNSNCLIDGAFLFLQYLKKTGRRIFLVTNNSKKSSEQYVKKCSELGLAFEASEIVCVSNVVAYTLAKKGVNGLMYVVGEEGIGLELDKVGIEHTGIGPDVTVSTEFDASHLNKKVSGVIVGYDSHFNYIKLMKAVSYIMNGLPFYATNEDALLPCKGYSLPGTGSLVASVRKASGVEPMVFGKPCKPTWDFIMENYGTTPETTIMVGDRLDTDIQFGNAHGLHTACVLTGVTSKQLLEEVRLDPVKEALLGPEHVFRSVNEMYQTLMEEDKQASLG